MSGVAIGTYPEPLAALVYGRVVGVIAVAIVPTQSTPMFLVADGETGEVTYVDVSEARLFPFFEGTDEEPPSE